MDDKEHTRDMLNRDRDRTKRGDKPSRFSDNRERDRSVDRGGKKSSNNRVYVSNISYEYRWQDLKDLFRNQVGEVSFVELFVDENDKPKGCGIVEFSDENSVKKCMEVMHRFELKGRKLVIKEDFGTERDKYGNITNGRRNRERDRHGDGLNKKDWDDGRERRGDRRPNWDPPSLFNNMMNRGMPDNDVKWGNTYGLSPQFLESLSINRPLGNRVFIANLDYKVDVKKLREVFKLAGKVLDVELYHDKEGNSRGFAVVDYDHPVESVQAISMFHNQMLFDRPMTVRMDRVENSDMPVRLPEGLKDIGMGLGVNGEPLKEVSRNLPSSTNSVPSSIQGAGILGAVPNPGLQNLGPAALSNVVSAPLAGLGTTAALQGLSNVQNRFLASNLNELGLANLTNSGLVGSSLAQNQTLAALANSNLASGNLSNLGSNMGNMGGSNMGGNMGSNSMVGNLDQSNMGSSSLGGNNSMASGNLPQSSSLSGLNTYNRSDTSNNYHGNTSNTNPSMLMNREYTSSNREYETSSRSNSYEMKPSNDDFRDDYRQQNNPVYTTGNNGSQRAPPTTPTKANYTSDTVVVGNLPTSAGWKMVREKFQSCGDIRYVEMKSKDTAVIRFSKEWEAERSIQLLDRTRIDGRTIDVRYF